MPILVIGTGKNQVEPGKDSIGDAPVLSLVCWNFGMKEKPTVATAYFGNSFLTASLR
jgi:hypothetical protein